MLLLGLPNHTKGCRDFRDAQDEDQNGRPIGCTMCPLTFTTRTLYTRHRCPIEWTIDIQYLMAAVKPEHRNDEDILALLTEEHRVAAIQALQPVQVEEVQEMRNHAQEEFEEESMLREAMELYDHQLEEDAEQQQEQAQEQQLAVDTSEEEDVTEAVVPMNQDDEEEMEECTFEEAFQHLVIEGAVGHPPRVDLNRLKYFSKRIIFPVGHLRLERRPTRMIDLDALSFVLSLGDLVNLATGSDARRDFCFDMRPQHLTKRAHFVYRELKIHKADHRYIGTLSTDLCTFKLFVFSLGEPNYIPANIFQLIETSLKSAASAYMERLVKDVLPCRQAFP